MPSVAIPLAGLTVLATLIGGRIGIRYAHHLPTLLALSGGVVVSIALLDVLPEGIRGLDDPNLATFLVAAGFFGFFGIERFFTLHNRDEAAEQLGGKRIGAIGAAGLSIHSFIDGLGIGLAFGVDSATGLLVFVAVVSHDFADGLNTVSYVLRRSGDRRAAYRWLLLDAAAPLLGAIVGSLATISDASLAHLLCVYCGFFLYLGATDLLPAAHEQPSWTRVGLTFAGFGLIFAITRLAGV